MDTIFSYLNELDIVYHQSTSNIIKIFETTNQADFFSAVELLAVNGASITITGTPPHLKAKCEFNQLS